MSIITNLMDRATAYFKVKADKLKLEIIAKMARIMANIVAFTFIGLIGLFFLVFLCVALGAYLNEVLESNYQGYFLMSGFFFGLIIIIFFLLRTRKIQNWLETVFINFGESLDEELEENEEEES